VHREDRRVHEPEQACRFPHQESLSVDGTAGAGGRGLRRSPGVVRRAPVIRRFRLSPSARLVLVAVPVVLSLAHAAPAQPVVNQEETSGGPPIVLGSSAKSGRPYIRVAGQGALVYPTVDITCDGKRWTLSLTRSEDGAFYEVSRSTVEVMLDALECRL